GTVNAKPGLPPVAVSVDLTGPLPRYDPTDLRDALEQALGTRRDLREALRERPRRASRSARPGDRKRALEALAKLNPEPADAYDSWLKTGMALHAVDAGEAMLDVWDQWSAQSDRYEPGACAGKWASFRADRGSEPTVGLGSLIHWAKEDGGAGANGAAPDA